MEIESDTGLITWTPPQSGDIEVPVTVKVTVMYDDISLTGFGLLPLPDNIYGEASMAKEGPP